MALDLGTLVGYLELDSSGMDKGVDEGMSKLESFGTKGAAVAATAGAAIAVAAGAALANAISVDAANDKLAAQLGLTEAESARVGEAAGNLYAGAYGESLEQVNDAVGAVMSSIDGMANASGARLEKVTAKALDFAAAFEVDVARSSQVAGQLIETGLAKNATEAFDLLTAASQKVPAAVREDVIDAADEYGQFFAGLGYDGEEAFAMLVDASKKGMYGIDKAGDAIKEFTIRSTDMSSSSKDAYKAIGLNAREMADKILKGGDDAKEATGKIIDGILGIENPSKRANAAIALFGTPLEDLNVKDIPKFLKSMKGMSGSMDDAQGASKRMGDTLNDNAKTNIESFKRQLTTTATDVIGGTLLPKVSEAASFLSTNFGPAVKTVTDFLADNEGVVVTLAGVVGTLAAGMLIYSGTVKVVTAVTAAWNAVQKLLNGTMRLNPIGLVVTALALLVAGLVIAYKKSETFRNIVKGAFEAVAAAGRWLWNNVLQPVFQFLVKGFATVMDWYAKMLRGLSKVPGFGWAAKAADGMEAAADKARELANDIKKIPSSKQSKITVDVPNLQRISQDIDWVARPRQSRITITQEYARAGRQTQGGLQERHVGGTVLANQPYLVGRDGAEELFVPHTAGRVYTQGQVAAGMGTSGGHGRELRPINVYDRSGDPVRTAVEVARQEKMAGVI